MGGYGRVRWGYKDYGRKIFIAQRRNLSMRKIMLKFISVIAVCGLIGCGTETKEAAKDAASSVAKLGITAVKEAGSGAVEIATDVAKETAEEAGEAIKETATDLKEKATKTAKQVADSVKSKVKEVRK
jgi:hypothetical protein